MTERISPLVSVVMGVYNGAGSLAATVDSVLSQQDCDFEFVIVNDGSTDNTGALLNEYVKRDERVRVLHQENTGLTRALISGCAAARGEFIARQDAGDVSLAGRLAVQAEFLSSRPDVVLTCTACRVVGPRDEELFDIVRDGSDLENGLREIDLQRIKGPPHHGSTMFRRTAYENVGGYRAAFYVAQDLDLWLRLVEVGRCVGLTFLGYQAKLEANSISGRRRAEQILLASRAIECAVFRRSGQDEKHLLSIPQTPRATAPDARAKQRDKAKFLYFIGACLKNRDAKTARMYFREAVQADRFFVKARLRLIFGAL